MVVIADRQAAPCLGGETDEAPARRALRAQIARLEHELASLTAEVKPRDGVSWPIGGENGPRLLGIGALERVRDDLAERLHEVRETLAARAAREAEKRALLERMLRDPARHRFVRISAADVGEPGCGVWHVRPRLGLIGMLMGWWQVKLSSGCPLPRPAAGPA
ncbi:MAG: hypothetical protein JSS99_16445 [Actinobacteria bacterium]|nr:hypothetical protein [Actinomycetota bacterium]